MKTKSNFKLNLIKFIRKHHLSIVSYVSMVISLLTFLGISNVLLILHPKPIEETLDSINLSWPKEKKLEKLGSPFKVDNLKNNLTRELFELENPYAEGNIFIQFILKDNVNISYSITNCSNKPITLKSFTSIDKFEFEKGISLSNSSQISDSPFELQDISYFINPGMGGASSYFIESKYALAPFYKNINWGFSAICEQKYFTDLFNNNVVSIPKSNSTKEEFITNQYSSVRQNIPLNTFGVVSMDYSLEDLRELFGRTDFLSEFTGLLNIYPEFSDRF